MNATDTAAALAHSHVAELTYVDNMPWAGAIVRTIGGHLRDGVAVTERMLDLALVGMERDHRAADTGRGVAAYTPRTLDAAPARTRRRSEPAARRAAAETIVGTVRYRGRSRGVLRVQVELADGGPTCYVTWPADAATCRPGDTVEIVGSVDRDRGRITRVTSAARTARPHQQ